EAPAPEAAEQLVLGVGAPQGDRALPGHKAERTQLRHDRSQRPCRTAPGATRPTLGEELVDDVTSQVGGGQATLCQPPAQVGPKSCTSLAPPFRVPSAGDG